MIRRTGNLARALTIVIALCAEAVYAEPSLSNFNKLKNDATFKIYLQGVGAGFSWYNTYLKIEKGIALFCAPGKVSLNHLNYIQMIESYSADTEKMKAYLGDPPVNLILLDALIESFPCKQGE